MTGLGVPDLSVDTERDESGNEIVCAKFSDNNWELNVRAPRSRFSALRSIRTQDSNSRSVVAAGVSAGADALSSSDGAIATIMVGQTTRPGM
jgi:hypothetical protein